ncbi:MAG TPA: hypothetical protein VHZ01_06475 [Casimicrobiaceae bacterium]|nr:hypothetical protein [Casimicrobiaceae bacterium]
MQGAAETCQLQTGRAGLAREIVPDYVDVAVLRWQNFTGQEARHAESGEPFASIAQARAPQAA